MLNRTKPRASRAAPRGRPRTGTKGRYPDAMENAPIGMAIVGLGHHDRSGRLRWVNRALCEVTGHTEEELLATKIGELGYPDDNEYLPITVERLLAHDAACMRVQSRYVHSRGETIWIALSASVVRDDHDQPQYAIVQVEDVTERKVLERRLTDLADHDHLTGLYNRWRLEKELCRQVAYSKRYGGGGALLLIDIDNFKYVNDTLGHAVGDELIGRVAAALETSLRGTDVLARLGGDEFAVILPEVDTGQATALADKVALAVKAVKIHAGSRMPPLGVTASIGVALFDARPDLTADELLVDADIAMYEAKELGRDRHAVADGERRGQARLAQTACWADRIRAALKEERFVLYAQPILDLRTKQVARHELLLRMIGEDGEVIPPSAFLYVAERFGLVQEIDAWVVRKAISVISAQERAGRRLRLEVNLSGVSFGDPNLLRLIEREIAAQDIDPWSLVFEITETTAIVNIERAREFAERLVELGCGLALDDFGSGFGSFYYLKHLPIDVLKIDGEFVRNMANSVEDQLMVRSIARMATEMGSETIAEFVGDEDTLAMLPGYGVDHAQGFGVGRPRPISEGALAAA